MASPVSRLAPGLSPPVTWSLSVGAYALACSVVLVAVLRQVTSLVADVLALPTDSALWLALPVPVVAAVVWWAVVERPGAHTYARGAAAGLATALLTVSFWVLRGAVVWDLEGVLAGWPLVVVVLVPTVPAGLLAGLPATYARRRLTVGPADRGG